MSVNGKRERKSKTMRMGGLSKKGKTIYAIRKTVFWQKQKGASRKVLYIKFFAAWRLCASLNFNLHSVFGCSTFSPEGLFCSF
jgi:hypothetical protein